MSARHKSRILFVFCVSMFLVHQLVERVAEVHIPIMDNYLDPLLAMPILLHLITWERRILNKNPYYQLPILYIALYVVIVSVLAEIVFPLWTPRLVSDPIDVILYVVGAGVYTVIENPVKRNCR